jgi:thymidylate synthase (FAD)
MAKLIEPGAVIMYPSSVPEWRYEAKMIERMGRIAYKSEDRINDTSYHNFLLQIVQRRHEAVLEFGSMTVLFVTDRGITHEQVRHRLCSFIQESTRYCNYSKDKFGNEISVVQPNGLPTAAIEIWLDAILYAEKSYFRLIEKGCTPQQARSILPTCTKAEIGIKANFREWRHIFRLRAISKAAHPDMRKLMIPLYDKSRKSLPEIFEMGDPE